MIARFEGDAEAPHTFHRFSYAAGLARFARHGIPSSACEPGMQGTAAPVEATSMPLGDAGAGKPVLMPDAASLTTGSFEPRGRFCFQVWRRPACGRQQIVKPPSIGRHTPEIIEAPSPSRNTIGAAISSSVARRPSGICFRNGSPMSGRPQ